MATSINKILVPLDNSKNSFRGLSSAIYLAKNCDAKIIVLHAVYAPPKGDFDTSGKFNKNHKKQLDSIILYKCASWVLIELQNTTSCSV